MKKSDIILDSIVQAVFLIVACVLSALISYLLTYILNRFDVLTTVFFAVFRAVVITVGTVGFLFLFRYRAAYHTDRYSRQYLWLTGGISVVFHLAVSLIFSFSPLVSGSPLYIASLIQFGANLTTEDYGRVSVGWSILAAVVLALLYLLVMDFAARLGSQKRKIDRCRLTGSPE